MEDPLEGNAWGELETSQDEYEDAIFTVVARDLKTGLYEPLGTGFVIRAEKEAALAISAAHVFEDLWRLQDWHPVYRSTMPGFARERIDLDLTARELCLLTKSKGRMVTSIVKGFAIDEGGDIAILEIGPQKGDENFYPLGWLQIGDDQPRIGDLVAVVSYAGVKHQASLDRPHEFQVERRAAIRVGRVTKIPAPEERRICRGPCFETTIPTPHGMSGGAVFNYEPEKTNRVVGVVSKDWQLEEPGAENAMIAGNSTVARLPIVAVHADGDGSREIELQFMATAFAGEFERFPGVVISD